MKMVDVIKNIPVWLVSGVAITLAMVCWIPALNAFVPPDQKNWLPLAVLFSVVILACLLSSKLLLLVASRNKEIRSREMLRHEHVYRPARVLLIDCHVTVAVGRGAPYVSQRIRNAWGELWWYKRKKTCLKMAFRALFDKKISSGVEVEFGSFPLKKISDLVLSNRQYAENDLINAIQRANRSRYEDATCESSFTDAEYDLYKRIVRESNRLSRRFD
ncbi:hypothetical protein [Pseudomonas sp. RW3S2]|uniref:hypothetical protein n=1 Tax=Pseudomonas sp. RW3S2 TaxID=485884 RepID=UPI001648D2D2|nr:hypothetical protein [Pseudomonas sp. RW3S2]MBC3420319.1 hypothetical protein [Pseudomonas sp. RW3S2]